MTSISPSLASILLSPQYKLEEGFSLASSLLGAESYSPVTFDILNSNYGSATLSNNNQGLQNLEQFVNSTLEFKDSLIRDLAAVSALSTMIGAKSRVPPIFGSYTSPYETALFLGNSLDNPQNIVTNLLA